MLNFHHYEAFQATFIPRDKLKRNFLVNYFNSSSNYFSLRDFHYLAFSWRFLSAFAIPATLWQSLLLLTKGLYSIFIHSFTHFQSSLFIDYLCIPSPPIFSIIMSNGELYCVLKGACLRANKYMLFTAHFFI